jgi:dTDP-glucose 4,6-dehydratase
METVAVIGSNSFSGQDFVDLLLAERRVRVVGVSRSPEKSRLFLSYKDRRRPRALRLPPHGPQPRP